MLWAAGAGKTSVQLLRACAAHVRRCSRWRSRAEGCGAAVPDLCRLLALWWTLLAQLAAVQLTIAFMPPRKRCTASALRNAASQANGAAAMQCQGVSLCQLRVGGLRA